MKITKVLVLNLFLAAHGYAASTTLDSKAPVFYLNAEGVYGRPLSSYGFSAKRDNGTGLLVGAEYRGWDKLSLGLNFSHINLQEDGVNATLGGLDVFGRFLFLGRGSVEPYLLLGAGYDVYLSDNRVKFQRDLSLLATAAMGTFVVLNPNWAFDIGAGYQYNGPASRPLNFPNMRIGVQYRFSRGAAHQDPAPETVTPRGIALKNLGGGRVGIDLGNGAMGQVHVKSWTLVVRDSNGRIVKTIEGQGAMPEELPIKGLQLGKGYSYSLGMKGTDGKDYSAGGMLEASETAQPKPEAAVESEGTHRVGRGESLWSIAALDRIYGDGLLWPLLYDANRDAISNWNVVKTGLILEVPKAGDEAARDEVRRRAYKTPWKRLGK